MSLSYSEFHQHRKPCHSWHSWVSDTPTDFQSPCKVNTELCFHVFLFDICKQYLPGDVWTAQAHVQQVVNVRAELEIHTGPPKCSGSNCTTPAARCKAEIPPLTTYVGQHLHHQSNRFLTPADIYHAFAFIPRTQSWAFEETLHPGK